MKRSIVFLLSAFLLTSCSPEMAVVPVSSPANTPARMPANTATPTATPEPLPITFVYQDNVPASARRIQEEAVIEAYTYFSKYADLGSITVYTFSDIDLIMDEVYASVFADGNISEAQFREGWPTTGGAAVEDKVLINPGHVNWSDPGCYKPKNVAHEIFHVTQAGLLKNRLRPDVIDYGPEWLKEGSAEVMGHLVADGIDGCSYQERMDSLVENISDREFSLRDVESGDFNSHEWFWSAASLAAFELARNSPDHEGSFFKYYAEIGAGKSWPQAFEEAFAVSIDAFYEKFAAYHDSIREVMDTSVCIPQSDPRIKCLGRKPHNDGGYIYLFDTTFGFNTSPDQWKQESNCALSNNGYEGSTEAVILEIYVDGSIQGTCHATFVHAPGQQFSIDFSVP